MKITLTRSAIGATPKQRKVLEALGLRSSRQTKTYPDNDAMRGMVKHVAHLVEVQE